MNIMRKLVGQSRPADPSQASLQDNTLGLMHLRKLFAEFRHPSAGASQKDQEDKLYNMLPLFCKVFGGAPSSDMTEKFGDILQFCSHVSKLMVTEIRRRASNQSTVEASCAIVKLLEIESCEESSNGWMLLSVINLLSTGTPALIDCMTAASLPSTLVKCLYLFFDLPDVENPDSLESDCQFTPRERRILLQKVFVQVLVRLCSHSSPAEELARKDDLSLLFSAITSWCPQHNTPWRKSAAEVLATLSRHGLTPNVTKYIHDKGCVRHCIENMQRVQELSPLELVEMFVTVFCFLKDSSEVSQTLLDDFRACQGYIFLSEFLLKLELNDSEEAKQALRNLVLFAGSLTTCGFIELKPSQASTGSLFHIPGFTIAQPTGKGVSVRNIQAFQVLQSVFLKAVTTNLCSIILDVINSVYHQDRANYFILEPQHTLSQFAEKIHLKPAEVQQKFFELLEFVVFELNFVPCKELISLSILIKSQHSLQCSILCMKSLMRIMRHHPTFKDAYREVGMLEVVVTCLHRYAALLKEPQNGEERPVMGEEEKEMGYLVMESLAILLSGNSANANVFRECGGARCAHNMVPYPECRQLALNIVQQLVLSPGGDDDMGTLLGLMHTAPVEALELKTHILKSLLNVLRESHRTRTVFRKVGGFVYVMSVLVSMEGCLADPPKSPWNKIPRKDILAMLKTVFSTVAVAMRYEPANAKFFATEVRYDSLTEAVRLLGCFSQSVDIQPGVEEVQSAEDEEQVFEQVFCDPKNHNLDKEVPVTMVSACLMIRYLYDMALDSFDRAHLVGPQANPPPLSTSSPSLKRFSSPRETNSSPQHSPQVAKRASTGSITLNLNQSPGDLIIVHAGAVMSMFHLLPAIQMDNSAQVVLSLQLHTAEVLKSLLRSERNQQMMCDVGFPHELLSHGNVALADESHPLHPPLQYMYERLASQSLTPRDLRDFLRLGSPLNCRCVDEFHETKLGVGDDTLEQGPVSRSSSMEENRTPYELEKKLKTAGGSVPLTRVKCLVSMTTPRDARMHGASVTPAFVEFDMSSEGFGCLYLPSIAPQGPPTPSVVSGVVSSSDPVVIGGIGTGERIFPPQPGLTYSTWYCVDKFSSALNDAHPVRLLTLVRNLQGKEENLICLSVVLSSRERALFVSTQETPMPATVSGQEQEQDPDLGDSTVRFWCPELTQEGQWHHLVLLFHRAGIMKNSNVSLFVDGVHVSTQKLQYISPNLGSGGTASPTAFTSVFAYIGTPPQLRCQSRLVWRQGPCHLIEDIVSSHTVQTVYQLGPNYVGSFQAPISEDKEVLNCLLAEEKVVFGAHAHAVSQMTVAKIRKVYNKVDSKSIAKQLAMSAHDNATPIRILHNSAGHLSGPARSLGAILMGYIGVRTFCPKPVAKMLENVGGTSALLGLIAMATDVEGLYAAVKALVCVVRSGKSAMRDMDRIRGYQTLGMLYKKKRHLLNAHILHLTFSLVGTVDSGRESSVIPNKTAFKDLLCDLEIWHEAPGDLQRSLYEHFYELLTDSSDQKTNLTLMHEIGLVSRLLHILKDPNLTQATIETLASVLTVMLQGNLDAPSLLRLGQFLVSTLLCSTSCSEKSINMNCVEEQMVLVKIATDDSPDVDEDRAPSVYNIKLRNTCLDIFLKLIFPSGPNNVNQQACEEIQKILGFDWLLLFMQSHLHSSTVILAFRILATFLRNPVFMQRFREGSVGGGWLNNTETVLSVLLGFNLGNAGRTNNREINTEVCHVPGFTALQWLLPKHANVPELYFLLMAIMLGQHVHDLPQDVELNLDAVWTVIFGVPASKPVSIATRDEFCPDSAVVLLAMIRFMLNQVWQTEEEGSWLREYPVTLMQFLLFLYHNQADFVPICLSGDFLGALVGTLFPLKQDNSESIVTTPSEEFKPFPEAEPAVIIKPIERSPSGVLSTHPARKFVMDFLRMIVMDSLTSNCKNLHTIDLILEATPEGATRGQRKEFQTEFLKSLMDHLLAADVLLGDQAAVPLTAGSNYSNMVNNVFYLASRIVDKLWQGTYTRESKELFDFISKLIVQAKRKSSGVSLDPVYKCLNRTVLFQLSRSIDNVACQMNVLDALHKLTSNRNLVFGPGNYDPDFLGCLCYCLLQLTENPRKSAANLSEQRARSTTWHVGNDNTEEPSNEKADMKEGLQLVATAARRVWDELYACKKPQLEDIFRVSLNNIDTSPGAKITTPELNDVRLIIQEAASRIWVNYAELERKTFTVHAEKLPTQIQSKLQKVGSGVLRLASRKVKKELPLKTSPASNVHSHDYILWMMTHVSIVKDLVDLQFKQYIQVNEHLQKYLTSEWKQTETELLRERGLWGPMLGSSLLKWMLDTTEGPCRMRKKLIGNELFYKHYPYRPDMDKITVKYKVAVSNDSKKYYQRFRSQSFVCEEDLPVDIGEINDLEVFNDTDASIEDKSAEITADMPKLLGRHKSILSTAETDDDADDSLGLENNQDGDRTDGQVETQTEGQTDNQAILRLLGEGEKISHMFRCARIQGLDTAEGLLLFGKEHFYVIDGFTLLTSKEIKDIDSLPPELHDPIIPRASKGGTSDQKRMSSKFAYEDIREVHKRRYLLQPIAVEVFSADGRNYLLALPPKCRNKVYAKFLTVATGITDNAQQSVSGQKQSAKVEPGTGLISSLIGEKSVTQRWERGEINNFQYLMHLNTLAGRSYNDLMQYPVFPWIVADYDADELDLTNPATFRDMSKPMGAQTPDRLKQFKKRFSDWDDPQGETPPYHYGTHYSSAMIVASYLLRMEPFTQHFLKLQGGHFDLADRMFHSVKENWLSASKHNMADVKELIPEFFYLPEFLVNSNNFDLGCKQSGVYLGDVILPNWAKGDPKEFIRAHREALECDFVSAHLHEWIDLIFGYKQKGQHAVESVNVFHHLFYEGNVDIYSIDDPLKKNATIGFINNFGQIAKQLFKKAHPPKKLNSRMLDPMVMAVPSSTSSLDKLFFHHVDNLKPSLQPVKELKSAVGQIISTDRSVLAVEQNKVLVPPAYNKYLAWGFSDLSVRIGNYESDKASCVFECLDNGEILCAASPNSKLFITGGTSCVVSVWEYQHKDKKVVLKQPLFGHTEPVTCLSASPAYNVIVSGSRDKTCIIWDMSRLVYVRQLRGHTAPVAAVCINELTGDIATCAGTYLHVWDINGTEIAVVNTATSRNQQILCVAMSQMMEWDIRNVILTGSSEGVVRMWSVEYVQVPDEVKKRSKTKGDQVDSLPIPPEVETVQTQPIDIPNRNRRASCDSYDSPGRTAAERLKDFKDPDLLAAKRAEILGSSAESDSHVKNGKDKFTDHWELPERLDSNISTTSSTSDLYRCDDGASTDGEFSGKPPDSCSQKSADISIDAAVDALMELEDSGSVVNNSNMSEAGSQKDGVTQPVKDLTDGTSNTGVNQTVEGKESKTSPSAEYVVITDSDVKAATAEEVLKKYKKKIGTGLREGFKWQRQLMFRSKLTMHTAFERKDNRDPAAVTAIAVSKDHKTVYVGDAKGRIFSWTVTDQPGRVVADHWMKDEGVDGCLSCGVKFSLTERRHHCRNCGQLFCSRCSRFETEIRRLRIVKPVRVCQSCYNVLKAQQASDRLSAGKPS